MVEPISRSLKSRSKGKSATGSTPVKDDREKEKKTPVSAVAPPPEPRDDPAAFPDVSKAEYSVGMGMPASTTKARKVMQWFRTRSNTKSGAELSGDAPRVPSHVGVEYPSKIPTPIIQKAETSAIFNPKASEQPRSPQLGDASFSLSKSGRIFGPTSPKDVLRVHHGAVDQTTITTRPPPEVMKHVREVLEGMGVEIKLESEYKYRCIRLKKGKGGGGLGFSSVGSGSGLAAFTMVDKRGLPLPSHPSTGGMLRGLLMRRQSSQVSASGAASSPPSINLDEDNVVAPTPMANDQAGMEPIFGDTVQDAGDEVRFSVELTRIDRLKDTYSLDIRRLKGNLRSYKFLYDTLRERADLQR
ncbi:hypothetical protein SERLA73DRAFT_176454 [Serpula lacrymans var. lacrymans S7.3]|uniref:non-specific serine/threonine protein kinase n=1 Tax=Serpula lacrymans var. lacrymans (strain S7.3) TaxID=936435 RepID=F8PMY2_SERL3|nr:hypothetical protein SERLA73DRAFT_176454 [Serpula lacrymans var. lacrymans S7.3]